jgi:hypothetical protein
MVSRRSLETATALLTGTFGAAVVVSSYGNGIGWSSAGVDPGTFPFIVGLIILIGSIFNLAQGWLQAREVVLRPAELKRLGMLFIPAAVYVGVIPLIGIYLASAAYVFGALLAQARRVHLLRPRCDRHGGGALSDLRAHVPDLVAARPARRRTRLLRGIWWKISKPCCTVSPLRSQAIIFF